MLIGVKTNYPDMSERIAWSFLAFVAHGTSFNHTRKHLAASIEESAVRQFADTFDQSGLNYGKMTINFPCHFPIDLA